MQDTYIYVVTTFKGGPMSGSTEILSIKDHPIGSMTRRYTLYRAYNERTRTRAVYRELTRTSSTTAVIRFVRIENYK